MPHIVSPGGRRFIVEWSIAAIGAVLRCRARGRTYGDGGAGLLFRVPRVLHFPGGRGRAVPADRDGEPAPAAHVADRRAPLPRLRRGPPGVRAVLPKVRAEVVAPRVNTHLAAVLAPRVHPPQAAGLNGRSSDRVTR